VRVFKLFLILLIFCLIPFSREAVLEEDIFKKVRIYNGHPSSEPLFLLKETKLLSKSNGVVYKLTEDAIVPGMEDVALGYVDVPVQVIRDGKGETIITIPGLNSTDYFETTWGEVIDENKKEDSKKETNVNGIISKDTIWELKNSPYIVTGNIFVLENVTLLIEQGVEVVFNKDYVFLIEGEVKIVGEKKGLVRLKID
jgi:hypothetical protein